MLCMFPFLKMISPKVKPHILPPLAGMHKMREKLELDLNSLPQQIVTTSYNGFDVVPCLKKDFWLFFCMCFSSVLIVHVLDEPSNKVRAAIQRNIRQKAKTQHYLRFNPLQILSQPALIPNPHSLKVVPQILALCLAKRIRPFPICHREASCSNGVCLLETESSWARGGP